MSPTFNLLATAVFFLAGPITCAVQLHSAHRDIAEISAKLGGYEQKDWARLYEASAIWHGQLVLNKVSFERKLEMSLMPVKLGELGFPDVFFTQEGFAFRRGVSGGPGVHMEVMLHPDFRKASSWPEEKRVGVFYSYTHDRRVPGYVYLHDERSMSGSADFFEEDSPRVWEGER